MLSAAQIAKAVDDLQQYDATRKSSRKVIRCIVVW